MYNHLMEWFTLGLTHFSCSQTPLEAFSTIIGAARRLHNQIGLPIQLGETRRIAAAHLTLGPAPNNSTLFLVHTALRHH